MASTAFGVIVRQQAWFRPVIDLQNIGPFPIDQIDVVPLDPVGAFRARVLLGRGPVERDLTPEFFLWFEHGAQEYPVFQCPSIGPSGAALKLSNKPRRLVASGDEALVLIEISLIQPVHESFRAQYEADQQPHAQGGPAAIVRHWLSETRRWLEQAIGLYALYQYPVVWEPLGVHPLVGFVDIETQTFQVATQIEPDNFIPFRLDPSARLTDGHLADGGLTDFSRLGDRALHFPLFLLQRALWQRNVQLRFLETFLLLDYLMGQSKVEDPSRLQREELFAVIEDHVHQNHPKHVERVKALKHVVLQAPLRERLKLYLERLGVAHDEESLRRMLKVRNDLAHARPVSEDVLMQVELETRTLAREVMRRELAAQGIAFGIPGTAA
jgi:hypothetical protein